jgi:hypothetical protein
MKDIAAIQVLDAILGRTDESADLISENTI